jgi:DNA-binding transcriptional MerR regulator
MRIGDFATLVGLSIPQLRRYDRMQLLEPEGRSEAGYRRYSTGQTGNGRVISLLRSIDVPIADIRRVLAGIADDERRRLFADHRARLEARLDEVRRLLDAVDSLTKEEPMTMNAPTELSTWLHVMPRIPVSDVQRSIDYYQEALGLRLAWQTGDGSLSAIASRVDRGAAAGAVERRGRSTAARCVRGCRRPRRAVCRVRGGRWRPDRAGRDKALRHARVRRR